MKQEAVVRVTVFAGLLLAALACRSAQGAKPAPSMDMLDAPTSDADIENMLDSSRMTTVAIPPGTKEVTVPFRLGNGWALRFVWDNGRKTSLDLRSGQASFKKAVMKDGEEASMDVSLPDKVCLEIPALKVRYHVRPNPWFYDEAALLKLRGTWSFLPDLGAHRFLLSLQLDPDGVGLSIDGNYVGRVAGNGRLKAVSGVWQAADVQFKSGEGWERWTPLDIQSLDRPGAMTNISLNVQAGALEKLNVPMRLGEKVVNADVGCMRNLCRPLNYDNCDYPFLSRSAFDAMPESLLMSVPSAPYTRAWVLCAAEDDPGKDRKAVVRLIRYRLGGIGNAMVNTELRLPRADEAPGPDLIRVGDVSYTVDKVRKTVPLWLAEVRLDSGEIQDVKYSDWAGGRLDLELMGANYRNLSVMNGVHVFAMTLEKSPVEMEVRQVVSGSVFHNDEKPEMKVALRPLAPAACVLRWVVSDVWTNTVATGERKLEFAGAGAEQVVSVPLAMKDNGWYEVVFSLADERGRALLGHTAAFAQLAPDTRLAGYESRYGCWWQPAIHGGTEDPNIIGPLLLKAGLRRTTITCKSESNMAPWKVTLDMVTWKGPKDTAPQEWIKEFEEHVRDCLKEFPHTGLAMIFHESYGAKSLAPGELVGGEPDPVRATPVEVAKLASAMFREKFPGLKVIIGNSNWAGDQMSMLLRGGLPPDGVDGLGMERLLNLYRYGCLQPEMHEASWCLRQIGLKYGCKAPPSDCYESGGRGGTGGMAPHTSAEFVVRDSLVGWAWNYPYIGVGCVSENVFGYYTTIYGGAALVRRFPLLYPTPSYVSVATMTRVLDSVTAPRRLATGSHTAYGLEFPRGDERVYALWTPRGLCAMTMRFPKDVAVTVDGLYGNRRTTNTVNGELVIQAGEEVTYVTAPTAAANVTAGKRAFPDDVPPAAAVVLDPMDNAGRWTNVSARALDTAIPCGYLPWRMAGEGRLSEVADPERGKCLRVDLVSADPGVEMVGESVSFAPKDALPLPGRPGTLGVWVRGNSSWGRVVFEIMDAEGERFRGGSDNAVNPAGTSLIDFDGWCFVSLPLTAESPMAAGYMRRNAAALWSGNGGNGKIDYPVRVTGLSLEMRRHALDLTEMVSVDPAILLKDLSAY